MQESDPIFVTPVEHKMKKSQIVLLLLAFLFLGFVLYRLNTGKPVNFQNKAASAVNMESELAERAMVYGYAEQSAGGTRYKLRVETPPSFAFTPQSLGVESTPNEISLNSTHSEYPCMSMHEGEHMPGYETEWFTEGIGESLDAKVKVLFTDEAGKLFANSYTITHMCSVLSPDAVQQVEPPTELDAPSE